MTKDSGFAKLRTTFEMKAKELDLAQIAAIDRIKGWVERSIRSRDMLVGSLPTVKPSLYWQLFSLAFEYVSSMPSEQFKTLRLHTYHLDGDTYQGAFFSHPEDYTRDYTSLTTGVPERYRVFAPDTAGEYGHVIEGRLINNATLRWQELIQTLWRSGVLAKLEAVEYPRFLEIGGGYGSLANHFHHMFPNALYIIVDIPETLIFSASYLTLIHGKERVSLYEGQGELSLESLEGSPFFLLPDYALTSLSGLHFDLVINVQSFQEMTSEQVNRYLAFLAPRAAILISDNQDRQNFNTDDVCVSELLSRFFSVKSLPHNEILGPFGKVKRILGQSGASMARRVIRGLTGLPRSRPVRRFLATPLANSSPGSRESRLPGAPQRPDGSRPPTYRNGRSRRVAT